MSEPTDAELQARLKSLSAGLAAQKHERQESQTQSAAMPKADTLGQAYSLGVRVTAELVAGVAVGALMGWQLDRWFGTSPWLMIVFLFLGTAAGFYNVYRIAAAPTTKKGQVLPTLKDDDEEN